MKVVMVVLMIIIAVVVVQRVSPGDGTRWRDEVAMAR